MSAQYEAVIYENKAEEPLLSKEEKEGPTDRADVFARFKTSSIVLGVMVGFFIQFSTLGANYLALSLMGEAIMKVTQRELIIFSLVWSLITSSMAIIVLAFLRNLIFSTYLGKDIDNVVLHMECRYVVGALIGVCTAWAATDVALGMTGQVIYSVATLGIALTWCRVMMYFFTSSDDDDDEVESQTESDDDEILYV